MTPLSPRELGLLRDARRAVLATTARDGSARLVPITFVIANAAADGADADGDLVFYSSLDEKPKSVADPRDLARVRDIEERPRVAVLVDVWSEDWAELGWIRLAGSARLIEPDGRADGEHGRAIGLLRQKYSQYAAHELESRPVIRVQIDLVRTWFASP